MPNTDLRIDTPTLLEVFPTGNLAGSTRRYEKFSEDMSGVYIDEAAWQDEVDARGQHHLVYSVNEQKYFQVCTETSTP
jgi:hypothetical protein